MRQLSFVVPGRNNLKYFKWSYDSIRKNLDPKHIICFADDASTDGTWEWITEQMKIDNNLRAIRNEGPDRLGHTILYDRIVNELVETDIFIIWHCDMYACPGMDNAIDKHIKPGTVVSATRIEPPLHPPGPEKQILDCGIEPEEFNEQKLLDGAKLATNTKITEGIFAPWAIYKSDFQAIGGHDPLFAPQSKEDSDIFNRFLLKGYKFIQTWEGFVYHMTCRGSRFKDGAKRNPDGQVFMAGRETDEWLMQNQKSSRNFIRKWGHYVKHDHYMKPVIPHKYNIGIVINFKGNIPNIDDIAMIEPWCDNLYIKSNYEKHADDQVKKYVEFEQKNTKFNLFNRIKLIANVPVSDLENDIVLEFAWGDFMHQAGSNFDMNFLQQLPEIIADSGEIGVLSHGRITITIKSLKTYEDKLIFIDKERNYVN